MKNPIIPTNVGKNKIVEWKHEIDSCGCTGYRGYVDISVLEIFLGLRLNPEQDMRVQSSRTGTILEFAYVKTVYCDATREDIGAWEYCTMYGDVYYYLTIFND